MTKKKNLNKKMDFGHLTDEQFLKLEKYIQKWMKKNLPCSIEEVPDYVVEAFKTVQQKIKLSAHKSGQIAYAMENMGFHDACEWLDDGTGRSYVDLKKYKALLEKVKMSHEVIKIEEMERKEELEKELKKIYQHRY